MKTKTLKVLIETGITASFGLLIAICTIEHQGETNVVPKSAIVTTEETRDMIPMFTEADEYLSFEEIHRIHSLSTEEVEETEAEQETETETEAETEQETSPQYIWTPYDFINLDASVQTGIKSVCDRYQIAYDLILAICMQESSLDPNCVGDCGRAFGLGQIREEYWSDTAAELGLFNWKTDPVENSEMVCYIMSRQMNGFGMTMESALNIYRHGVTYDITEPDGLTYVSHIKNNLAYIEEMKGETEK